MKQIPKAENALVPRTDFSNQTTWAKICAAIQKPVGVFRFRAYVEYANLSKDELLERIPKDYKHTFMMIVDRITISHPEHALLILDLYEGSGNEFRAIPSQIQGIENNLSIANMDFEDFADSLDEDGVFRGFPRSGFHRLLTV